MNDAELAAKVAEADGRVFIGFKDSEASAGVDETGRVLVSSASVAASKARLRALGLEFEIEFIDMPTVVTRIPSGLVAELRANPLIEYIEPIFPGERHVQTITWNVSRVEAPTAWSFSTGSGAKLLIIDSGVRNDHPDLAPAVIQSCESPPTNGLDFFGHGTNVAGVATAVDNDIQIVGVAHGVALWSSKDGNQFPSPAYTACGVQFGRINGVHAINISTGYASPYTALTDQINAAYNQQGIVVVASAGNANGGAVTYPATLGTVIAVSATDINNNFASFSSAGSKVELAAPGAAITTTCLGGGTCSVNGTSFSAPHVAAAAALLKAYNASWSNVEIRRRLGAGATDLGAPGKDNQFGYGLLNIVGAIQADIPLGLELTGPGFIQTKGTYTYTANTTNFTNPSFLWAERFCDDSNGASCTTWQTITGLGNTFNRTLNPDCGTPERNFQVQVTVTNSDGRQLSAGMVTQLCQPL